MPDAHFNVQDHIGSKLESIAVWTISLADVLHRNIKGFAFSKNLLPNICVILSRWQLQLGFEKKRLLQFFSFFVPHVCTFKRTKSNWIISILELILNIEH